MKRSYLICLLLLLRCAAWAQPYLRLPPQGMLWQIEQSGEVPPAPAWSSCFLKYTAEQDTVLGYPVTALRDSAGYDRLAVGQEYIYEDSTGKGFLLAMGFFNPVPELVWDYGATVGQMVQGGQIQGLSYLINSIDTVTYADNIPRKRLSVSCFGCGGYDTLSGSSAIWVEGLGDILNGPTPRYRFETTSSCLCVGYFGTVLTLGTPAWQCVANCLPQPVHTTDALPLHVEVFPQPAKGSLRLRCEAVTLQVRLRGLDGRSLSAWELTGAREHMLSLPDLVAGLYLLEVRDEAGRLATRRVSVE
jgi:hypothetical protein